MKYFHSSKIFNNEKKAPHYEPLNLTDDQIDYFCKDMDLDAIHPVILEKLNILKRIENKPALPDKFDALISIDMQKEFAKIGSIRNFLLADRRGNLDTEETAHHAGRMIKAFRKAGTPIYSVYSTNRPRHPEGIDFYGYSYEPSDKLVHKDTNSAFHTQQNNFAMRLNKYGHKNLLFAGFNTSACVKETMYSALEHGFQPWLMLDCTADDICNGSEYTPEILKIHKNTLLLQMHKKGVQFITAHTALQHIKASR